MELIERYVHDVGRRLPAPTRRDVQAELRDLLEETLEERATESGRPPDEAMAVDVLREFGEPSAVAARYGAGEGALVGPRFYPVYVEACRVILAGAALAILFGLAVFLPTSQPTPDRFSRPVWLLPLVIGVATLGFTSFSWTVVALAFAERKARWPGRRGETWDPRRLPPVRDPDAASRSGKVFEILATLATAYVANRYLPTNGAWGAVLPLFNLLWAVQVTTHSVVLYQGRWRTPTRWLECGVALLLILALTRTLTVDPLTFLPPRSVPPQPHVRQWVAWIILINLRVTLAYALFDAGLKLYRSFKRRVEGSMSPELARARTS